MPALGRTTKRTAEDRLLRCVEEKWCCVRIPMPLSNVPPECDRERRPRVLSAGRSLMAGPVIDRHCAVAHGRDGVCKRLGMCALGFRIDDEPGAQRAFESLVAELWRGGEECLGRFTCQGDFGEYRRPRLFAERDVVCVAGVEAGGYRPRQPSLGVGPKFVWRRGGGR